MNLSDDRNAKLLADAISDIAEIQGCSRIQEAQDYAMAALSKMMRIVTNCTPAEEKKFDA